MFRLHLAYNGEQHATAVSEPNRNIVAIDCPFTGKGEEFSPASLFSISLASCMLLSMGAIGQRDNLDLQGTDVDVSFTGMEKQFPHVDTLTLIFNIPREFDEADRLKLERAAGLCPIMASIDDGTKVLTEFRYGVAKAA